MPDLTGACLRRQARLALEVSLRRPPATLQAGAPGRAGGPVAAWRCGGSAAEPGSELKLPVPMLDSLTT